MIIAVTGGRNFRDQALIDTVLYRLAQEQFDRGDPITHIINGYATGADAIARRWAIDNGIQPVDCPALWGTYPAKGPKNAGMRRNRAMLQLMPHTVVAFPGGAGTAHMVKLVTQAIEVWQALQGSPVFGVRRLIRVRKDGTCSVFPAVR